MYYDYFQNCINLYLCLFVQKRHDPDICSQFLLLFHDRIGLACRPPQQLDSLNLIDFLFPVRKRLAYSGIFVLQISFAQQRLIRQFLLPGLSDNQHTSSYFGFKTLILDFGLLWVKSYIRVLHSLWYFYSIVLPHFFYTMSKNIEYFYV